MNQRKHPRVEVSMLAEAQHVSFGTQICHVRDVSESGMFLQLNEKSLTMGAKLKVKFLNLNEIDGQATPTVEVVVRRIDENGFGLEFVNRTGSHLWHSVKRVRNELRIGRDYFQVHLSALLQHPSRGLLAVQQNGKWRLPGCYLRVGQDSRETLIKHIRKALNAGCENLDPLADSASHPEQAPEAALFRVVHMGQLRESRIEITEASDYSDHQWLRTIREVEQLSFAASMDQRLLKEAIEPTDAE